MRTVQNTVKYILALFWLFVTGFPLFFIFMSSLKGMMEYFTSSVWALPEEFQFGNYLQVFQAGFHKYFFNSLIVTSIAVFIVAISASMAANAIARFRFRYSNLVYSLFLAGLTSRIAFPFPSSSLWGLSRKSPLNWRKRRWWMGPTATRSTGM